MPQQREIRAMERSLTLELPALAALRDFQVETWQKVHARSVHALMREAYRAGGGSVVESFPVWYRDFVGDSEFDPQAAFLAFDASYALAGVALCWDCAFVKDLCVTERFRRRGVGTMLLVHAMHYFAGRQMPTLRLKVESDNPSGAQRLYEQLGFVFTPPE
jgi:ribosomal protein S18 acetylase RimI-like enzyme